MPVNLDRTRQQRRNEKAAKLVRIAPRMDNAPFLSGLARWRQFFWCRSLTRLFDTPVYTLALKTHLGN